MDILLSLRIIINGVFILAALLNASYAIPPVKEPSPITDTTILFFPLSVLAIAIPRPAEMDVELCPVLKASQSLSDVLGKPAMPPNLRRLAKPSFLPVSILWV